MSIFTYIGSKLRSAAAFFRDDFFDEDEIAGHRELINSVSNYGRLSELHYDLAKAKHQKKKHSHIQAQIDELRAKMGLEEV